MTNEEFRKAFEKFGEIQSANIVTDPVTRESRQFGFIKFADKAPVDVAVREMNDTTLEGRPIRVEVSKRSEPRRPMRYEGGRYRSGNDRYERPGRCFNKRRRASRQ